MQANVGCEIRVVELRRDARSRRGKAHGLCELNAPVSGLTLEPGETILMALIGGFPMHHIVVADCCVETCQQHKREIVACLFCRHAIANEARMLICKTCKTFD